MNRLLPPTRWKKDSAQGYCRFRLSTRCSPHCKWTPTPDAPRHAHPHTTSCACVMCARSLRCRERLGDHGRTWPRATAAAWARCTSPLEFRIAPPVAAPPLAPPRHAQAPHCMHIRASASSAALSGEGRRPHWGPSNAEGDDRDARSRNEPRPATMRCPSASQARGEWISARSARPLRPTTPMPTPDQLA